MTRKLSVFLQAQDSALTQVSVNESSKPTCIKTSRFSGRVLVRLRDFETRSGEQYFQGRSRRFAIYFEGRFNAGPGETQYNGNDIVFGADLDKPIGISTSYIEFGKKIISYVDPAITYSVSPVSGRCRLASAALVSMNVIGGWQSPESGDGSGTNTDNTPRARVNASSHDKGLYTSFKGAAPAKGHKSSASSSSLEVPRGTAFARSSSDMSRTSSRASVSSLETDSSGIFHHTSEDDTHPPNSKRAKVKAAIGKLSDTLSSRHSDEHPQLSNLSLHDQQDDCQTPMPTSAKQSFITPPESPITSTSSKPFDQAQDQTSTSNDLGQASEQKSKPASVYPDNLDAELGPWRFDDPELEPVEDNEFLLGSKISTSKRRKHFSNLKKRQDYVFDPDIVYAGSFHSSAFDFNTYNLHMGPINLNMLGYLKGMPLAFALGTDRVVDTSEGKREEIFFRVIFKLSE